MKMNTQKKHTWKFQIQSTVKLTRGSGLSGFFCVTHQFLFFDAFVTLSLATCGAHFLNTLVSC